MPKKKALALFSGGLDSMLSMKIISDMGIEVQAININFGFGGRMDTRDILTRRAAIAGATFESIDVREQYIAEILYDPKYGYGKQFNPCIDCHGFMFHTAKALLPRFGADFIITGEVLGQRPMSQRKDALHIVKKLAGDDEGLILRPMCAKLLEPTKPVLEGWVDGDALLDISGRGRDRQLAMAAAFGWEDYASPGGGCLLTDPRFSDKLKEFGEHDTLHVDDIDVLKHGRHLRLPDGAKLVVGRNENENNLLRATKSQKFAPITIEDDIPAPYSLLSVDATEADSILAGRLALAFAKTTQGTSYSVTINTTPQTLTPLPKTASQEYLI